VKRKKGIISRIGAGNMALVIVSVMLAYLAAEPLFQKFVVPRLALNKQEFLQREARVLAQSSKDGATPSPGYVALIGDSHALGLGDWLTGADKSARPPFHSAHLLHEASGRDVVTFGRGGAGSIDGLVVEPIKKIEFVDNLLLFEMGEPGVGLVYFYEGNDLNDNLGVLERHFYGDYDAERIFEPEYFRAFLDKLAAEAAREAGPADNLILGRFLFEAADTWINAAIKGVKRSVLGPEEENPLPEPVTRVKVGGEIQAMPPYMQGPALGLGAKELEIALYAFRQSLAALADNMPQTEFFVVYVPSPLSTYEIVSDSVHAQAYQKQRWVYPAVRVRERSDEIAEYVQATAALLGMDFIDTRPELGRAAEKRFLHGPGDWRHFNRAGYEAFTEIILTRTGLAPGP
jgi:hypothetical protein